MRLSVCVFVGALSAMVAGNAEAATRTVCSSGCQYADLQAAIDAAAPGDVILLRAGQTFTGNFILRNKKTASTQFITIRSDAAASSLPPDGVRLVPEGQPGANTKRSALARIIGKGGTAGNTPLIRTEAGAHHYRLQFLEFDGLANLGYGTLIAIGTTTGQDTAAKSPHTVVIDRCWAHGHPVKGMRRGIAVNARAVDVLNSYFDDFFAFAEAQALSASNGAGPFRIINNHLEGAGENVIFGGDDPQIDDLVASDIEIRGNYMPKNLAWRNPVLKTPGKPSLSATGSSGALAAGTHFFKVVAVLRAGGGSGYSVPSAEAAIGVSAGQSVRVSWSGVAGADRYRIYRGTSPGAQGVYIDTPDNATSFTYTGSGEQSGKPKATGTYWSVKNLLELKNAQRVVIDGNVFEHIWVAAQDGFAILFTVRNQSGGAPWSVVRDVTFTNNLVRHAAAGIKILGHDYNHPSQQTRNIRIANNVFEDLSSAYGNTGRLLSISEAPANITVDHNTILHTGSVVEVMAGAVSGFVFTNNLARHNTYGIKGQSRATGIDTLNTYFPGHVVKGNVLAGGKASSYPAGNYFPPASDFLTQFVNAALGDFRLASSSAFNNKGTDGKDVGADIGALEAAQQAGSGGGTDPGDDDEGDGDPPPAGNAPPVAVAGGPYSGTAGAPLLVDGSRSTDAEAPIVRYDWHFGEDIVLGASDVPAANMHGRWRRVSASGAAGGIALENPNAGEAKKTTALASPANYVDIRFEAASGVPYYFWMRMKAAGDASANDSVHVQFSGAVSASGAAIYRTGTTNSMPVVLEKCDGAGRSGWGWNDGGWCEAGAPIYFAAAGRQTVRIQQREDGLMFDQIVMSAAAYTGKAPGTLKAGTTIVPAGLGADTGITARHTYKQAGTYPVRLWVTDSVGQESSDVATAAVSGTGAGDSPVGSRPEIVLYAADVPAADIHGRWARVSVGSAAEGIALENANLGEAKKTTALAAPANYVDLRFTADAGVPYYFWLRMKAASNASANDSVHVQFNGSVNASGGAIYRTGTINSMPVVLEKCDGAGRSGWGWNDGGWCEAAGPIYFAVSGPQGLRIQQREDGVMFDQVVLSAVKYAGASPGALKNDTTILEPRR